MKKFCESLREHTMEIIIFLKKEMNSSTNKQQKSCQNAKIVVFIKKNLKIDMLKIKNILKLGTIAIILGNIEVLHIAYII